MLRAVSTSSGYANESADVFVIGAARRWHRIETNVALGAVELVTLARQRRLPIIHELSGVSVAVNWELVACAIAAGDTPYLVSHRLSHPRLMADEQAEVVRALAHLEMEPPPTSLIWGNVWNGRSARLHCGTNHWR